MIGVPVVITCKQWTIRPILPWLPSVGQKVRHERELWIVTDISFNCDNPQIPQVVIYVERENASGGTGTKAAAPHNKAEPKGTRR